MNEELLKLLRDGRDSGCLIFVTADNDEIGKAAHDNAERILAEFGLRVVTPFDYAQFVRSGQKLEDYFGVESHV